MIFSYWTFAKNLELTDPKMVQIDVGLIYRVLYRWPRPTLALPYLLILLAFHHVHSTAMDIYRI